MGTGNTKSFVTDKGRALDLKLIATADALHLTKAQLGDGVLPAGASPYDRTGLVNYVMDASIEYVSPPVAQQIKVVLQAMPTAVTATFIAKEAALFASDPDEGEILYAYVSMVDDPVELKPISNGVGRILNLEVNVLISNISEVTAEIDPAANTKLLNLINKRSTRLTVGTSTAGHTLHDCDFLCDGVDDQVEINQAVQALGMGANEVRVLAGNYSITAPVEVNKAGITLSGEGEGEGAVLNRAWDSAVDEGVISVSNDSCTIYEVTVNGHKETYASKLNAGIFCISGKNIKVIGCHISNSYKGIYYKELAYGEILGNEIASNQFYGIHLNACSQCNVSQNLCTSGAIGIHIGTSSNCIVEGNTCTDNLPGIRLMSTSECVLCRNNCSGISLSSANCNIVKENNIISNVGGTGLSIGSASDSNRITHNMISSDALGISITSARFNIVSENNLECKSCVTLYSASNNTITGNICTCKSDGVSLSSASKNVVCGNIFVLDFEGTFASHGILLFSGANYNEISANVCFRGSGLATDYASYQYTIRIQDSSDSNNLVVSNSIMGKNYTDGGTNNTFANNKYQ